MSKNVKKLILLRPENLKKLIKLPLDITTIETNILKIILNRKLNISQRLAIIGNLLFEKNLKKNIARKLADSSQMTNDNVQMVDASTNTKRVRKKNVGIGTRDVFNEPWTLEDELNTNKQNPFATSSPRQSQFANFTPDNLYANIPLNTAPANASLDELDLSGEKRDFIEKFNEIADDDEDIRDVHFSDSPNRSYLTGTSKKTGNYLGNFYFILFFFFHHPIHFLFYFYFFTFLFVINFMKLGIVYTLPKPASFKKTKEKIEELAKKNAKRKRNEAVTPPEMVGNKPRGLRSGMIRKIEPIPFSQW
jgi:hypothetical protein